MDDRRAARPCGWRSHGSKGKELGKPFICSRQETHPPALETWPWLLNGASVRCHRPAIPGREYGVGGDPAAPCPWPSLRATWSHARAQAGVPQHRVALPLPILTTSGGQSPNPSCAENTEGQGHVPAGVGYPGLRVEGPSASPRRAAASPMPPGLSVQHERMTAWLHVAEDENVARLPVPPEGGGAPWLMSAHTHSVIVTYRSHSHCLIFSHMVTHNHTVIHAAMHTFNHTEPYSHLQPVTLSHPQPRCQTHEYCHALNNSGHTHLRPHGFTRLHS